MSNNLTKNISKLKKKMKCLEFYSYLHQDTTLVPIAETNNAQDANSLIMSNSLARLSSSILKAITIEKRK